VSDSQLLLNLDEAAALLSLTRGALYSLTRPRSNCKPPVVRLGKKLMFRRDDLEAWVRSLQEAQ
jgi:excisionase family DNA binding protein